MIFAKFTLWKLSLLFSIVNFSNALDNKIFFPNLGNLNINAPTKLSNCKARLDDNSIVDLTSLDNPQNPR